MLLKKKKNQNFRHLCRNLQEKMSDNPREYHTRTTMFSLHNFVHLREEKLTYLKK